MAEELPGDLAPLIDGFLSGKHPHFAKQNPDRMGDMPPVR
jgi:hypothetical protein